MTIWAINNKIGAPLSAQLSKPASGHNYMRYNYIGHNYIGRNYTRAAELHPTGVPIVLVGNKADKASQVEPASTAPTTTAHCTLPTRTRPNNEVGPSSRCWGEPANPPSSSSSDRAHAYACARMPTHLPHTYPRVCPGMLVGNKSDKVSKVEPAFGIPHHLIAMLLDDDSTTDLPSNLLSNLPSNLLSNLPSNPPSNLP